MAYSELKRICGIYKITNSVNGKFYIGSSTHVMMRLSSHRTSLRAKKHQNIHLQRAFNKDGMDAFSFELLEECNEAALLEREQYFIDSMKCLDPSVGYNIAPKAQCPPSAKGRVKSLESRRKLSISLTGRKMPKEAIDKMRIRAIEWWKKIPPNQRKKSEDHRRKIGEANKGRTSSPETRRKIAETRRIRGIKPSEEFKRKHRERMMGTGNPGFGKRRSNTSRFRGVYPSGSRWVAAIGFSGKHQYLGKFSTEVDAALARDTAERKIYGNDAVLNFPDVVLTEEEISEKRSRGPIEVTQETREKLGISSKRMWDNFSGEKRKDLCERRAMTVRTKGPLPGKHKGTTKMKNGRWIAQLRVGGTRLHLGCFGDSLSAANAYDAAVRKHFGNSAYVNFPEVDEACAS